MATNISRRKLFNGALTAGLAAAATSSPKLAFGQAPARPALPQTVGLPNVWGQDFLYQWSPPDNVKRDLTVGQCEIRLSSPGIVNREGTDYNALLKSMRDGGWSACECRSNAWLERKLTDAQASEIKGQLKANDIVFYGLHCAGNIIAPDPLADQWQRHIVDAVHAAAQMDCRLVLTHAGSMYPNRNTPHPMNWSREGWMRSVNALKRICKDTAGINVMIALEDVNSECINSPWSHVRMREDVGDPRISVGMDVTNMIHPGVAFRMTELINTCFDLLGDNIAYVHQKDMVWDGMQAGLDWAMNGTGIMDYEVYLTHLSRLKMPSVNCLVEFLNTPEDYKMAQKNIRAIAQKVGVKIHGTMPA